MLIIIIIIIIIILLLLIFIFTSCEPFTLNIRTWLTN